jgi:PAS domain S-box-containing protein
MSKILHPDDLKTILDVIPLGLVLISKRGLLFLNRSAAHLFGLQGDSAAAEKLKDEKLTNYADQILGQEFFSSEGRLYKILRFQHKDTTLCMLIEISSLEHINQFFLSVDFAEEILKFIFTNPYEGMNVVDRHGIIRYMSPTHEKFLGIEHGKAIGLHATKVIENTRLHIVARTGKAEIGKTQEMKGIARIVSRIPIRKDGQTIGAVGRVMFRDLYQLEDITSKAESLKKEIAYYKEELTSLRQTTFSIDKIIGISPVIDSMKEVIRKAAQVDLPVLILGETGTGKELVAHTIHNLSPRGKNPMVTVNVSAIPPELFESELFGYEPGSFTNADRKGRLGKFELANGNSIFLDEIGDLPFEAQSKLLRVLQEGYLDKIGSRRLVKSDFRIFAATNKDIDSLLDKERFRLDLFYRINALTITVPPLRERKEDIHLLVNHFIEALNRKYHLHVKGVTEEVITKFKSYDWPGNVRELQNEVSRACSFTNNEVLELEDFSLRLREHRNETGTKLTGSLSRRKTLDRTERELILEALKRTGGIKAQAAKLLGLSRTMLYKKLKDLEIDPP